MSASALDLPVFWPPSSSSGGAGGLAPGGGGGVRGAELLLPASLALALLLGHLDDALAVLDLGARVAAVRQDLLALELRHALEARAIFVVAHEIVAEAVAVRVVRVLARVVAVAVILRSFGRGGGRDGRRGDGRRGEGYRFRSNADARGKSLVVLARRRTRTAPDRRLRPPDGRRRPRRRGRRDGSGPRRDRNPPPSFPRSASKGRAMKWDRRAPRDRRVAAKERSASDAVSAWRA